MLTGWLFGGFLEAWRTDVRPSTYEDIGLWFSGFWWSFLGRFFYNPGATYRNYTMCFWNDPERPGIKSSSRTMTLGSSTELAENGIQIKLLFLWTLKNTAELIYSTSIWMIMMRQQGSPDIERANRIRGTSSSRKSYNTVKTSDQNGNHWGDLLLLETLGHR